LREIRAVEGAAYIANAKILADPQEMKNIKDSISFWERVSSYTDGIGDALIILGPVVTFFSVAAGEYQTAITITGGALGTLGAGLKKFSASAARKKQEQRKELDAAIKAQDAHFDVLKDVAEN
jgi:ABC-type uncharacterized transport system permease subunit